MNKRKWKFNFGSILYLLHFIVFYIKIRQKFTVALIWFHSFFSRKKSEIWIAFTFFEKWKVKSFSFSLFSRNEKWIDFWFHSFREVKVKLKSLEIEIEKWTFSRIHSFFSRKKVKYECTLFEKWKVNWFLVSLFSRSESDY